MKETSKAMPAVVQDGDPIGNLCQRANTPFESQLFPTLAGLTFIENNIADLGFSSFFILPPLILK